MGYAYSDYTTKLCKCTSIIGSVFTLVGGPICQRSTSIVALSATELEYMIIIKAFKEAIWLHGLVKDLGIKHVTS